MDADLAQALPKWKTPLLLMIDGVQDPHNLGACLRTAEAAGASGVITPMHRTAPLSETVRRIACGAAERVPVFQVANLHETIELLRGRGVRMIATSDAATQDLWDANLTGPLAIVMGAEDTGVRRLTRKHCDDVVRIPMQGEAECVNLSVAAGICLFEAVRQRR